MNIKKMRAETGMTQKQFAEYFFIPKRNIENWESGSRSCPEYLERLMQYKLEKEGLIKEEVKMTRHAIKKGFYEIREGSDIKLAALDNALEGVCEIVATFDTFEEAREQLANYRTTHMVNRYNHFSVITGTCFFIEEETLNPDYDPEVDSEWEEWESTGNFEPAEIE